MLLKRAMICASGDDLTNIVFIFSLNISFDLTVAVYYSWLVVNDTLPDSCRVQLHFLLFSSSFVDSVPFSFPFNTFF